MKSEHAARLQAERDEADVIMFPQDLIDEASHSAELEDIIEGQLRLFEARKVSLRRERDQIIEQISNPIIRSEELKTIKCSGAAREADFTRAKIQPIPIKRKSSKLQVFNLQKQRSASWADRCFQSRLAQLLGQVASLEIQVLCLSAP